MRLIQRMVPIALLVIPPSAQAQVATRSVTSPRDVSPAGAVQSVSAIRVLVNGDILVNDVRGRRLVLLNSALQEPVVVADSSGTLKITYSGRYAGLIATGADSSLFVDPGQLSMLLLNGQGEVVKVMAAPRAQDAPYLVGGPYGSPVIDRSGRLIFRSSAKAITPPPTPALPFQLPVQPDSAPLVRFSIASRVADTAGSIMVNRMDTRIARAESGLFPLTTINPMQTVDDWAAFSDGTIAIVRGRDYHVDWVLPDGATVTGKRIPFAWERLTDSVRSAIVDSARLALDKELASMAPVAGSTAAGPKPSFEIVEPSALPEFRPAFTAGGIRTDALGRLWIRTSKVIEGGAVYDIVNQNGLVERVKLPWGRSLAGFLKDGALLLAVQDKTGARIESVSLK